MREVVVSIVIVTYKTANLTVDCLRTIEAERTELGMQISVIVVDNSSVDVLPIRSAISENGWSSWVTAIEAPKNGGFAYGNNIGIEQAYRLQNPAYLHLLNPDTLIRKGAIGALVRFLETHPKVGIAGSRLEDPDGSRLSYGFRFPSILTEIEQGLSFSLATTLLQPWNCNIEVGMRSQAVDWVGGASIMIRRDVIDAIGGLDENYFLYFEEVDFCFRASKAGFSTWSVPESCVDHISGQSTQVTGNQLTRKPFPAYWFESRRRFYAANYGMRYAMLTDAFAILANSVGAFKRLLQGRRGQGIPHYITDLYQHSPLRSKNRTLQPIKHFVP